MTTTTQGALAAVRHWLQGVPYTDRAQVKRQGSPDGEDLTAWPLLSIGVEGADGSGPNTALCSVQYDTEGTRTGAAGGFIRWTVAAAGLSLDRGIDDDVSEVLVTITASKVTGEARILANLRVVVSDSGLA